MVQFSIINGNILDVPSDLVILKHAQSFFGADKAVADKLTSNGLCKDRDLELKPGEYKLVDTKGLSSFRHALFLGTLNLAGFSYDEMEVFAYHSMKFLSGLNIKPPVITTTVHGTGYGLDGGESLQRLILGYSKGILEFNLIYIERISFVTMGERSERMLSSVLEKLIDERQKSIPNNTVLFKYKNENAFSQVQESPMFYKAAFDKNPGIIKEKHKKAHVFVAMPFSDDFMNVYDYGIYPAVRDCGLICERVDESHFTGDILQKIRSSIENADLVIADLTKSRPNVYLEVGYAWGHGIPVIFLAKKGEKLHFDVSTHKCIYYGKFAKLSEDLINLIKGILPI